MRFIAYPHVAAYEIDASIWYPYVVYNRYSRNEKERAQEKERDVEMQKCTKSSTHTYIPYKITSTF